jgi:DNA polymerase III alpha subunit
MFRLEDRSAGFKAVAWPEAFQRIAPLLKDDARLIIDGRVESADGGEFSFVVNDARPLVDAVSRDARAMNVTLPDRELDDEFLYDLLSILNSASGKCDVFINLPLDGVDVKLDLPAIRVQGSGKMESDLRARGCDVNWVL